MGTTAKPNKMKCHNELQWLAQPFPTKSNHFILKRSSLPNMLQSYFHPYMKRKKKKKENVSD